MVRVLAVIVERRRSTDTSLLAALLRQGLGAEVTTEMVDPGQMAALTQIDVGQKPVRLIDERNV